MTYSLEISLAALSKLQQIVERQNADQELLARVLTDAVEKFEHGGKKAEKEKLADSFYGDELQRQKRFQLFAQNSIENPSVDNEIAYWKNSCPLISREKMEALLAGGSEFSEEEKKEGLDRAFPVKMHISAEAEHAENCEKREKRRADKAAQVLTEQLGKLHKAAEKLDEPESTTSPNPPNYTRQVKERAKWGSGKNKHDGKDYTEGADKAAKSQIRQQDPLRKVIDKRIKEGIDPNSDDKPLLPPQVVTKYKNGFTCVGPCKGVKPGRWMERKADKYTGWCQNCANKRDRIDSPRYSRKTEF